MNADADAQKIIRSRRRRRMAVRLNVAASVLLAGLFLVMINYMAGRYYVRGDWSRAGLYRLSDKTIALLDSLTDRLDVVVFFQRGHPVFNDVENLLREYQYESRHIRVEYVDPDRNLARTEELARRFDVDQPNAVVFHSGGRSKYVTAEDIMEFDRSGTHRGVEPRRRAFRGEQAFSSAIHSVTQARVPVVYFLRGHGERDILSFDRYAGYSGIAREIRRDNIEVDSLVLGAMSAIPDDCDVLVIAGPTRRISQPELDLISGHLEASGRVMILLDAYTQTGLESVLADWGVKVEADLVMDGTRTFSGRELFITEYGHHPITRPLRGITSIFHTPRSVEPAPRTAKTALDQADRPYVTVLAASSASGWAQRDLEQSPMRYDPGVDRPGPISVAVAVERGPVPGIDVQIRPTRLVVFGDSGFVSNGAMTGGDVDFFMSALNWLLEREEMMAIAPRTYEQMQLVLTKHQLRRLFWVVVAGLPGGAAVLGLIVWVRRRR